MTELQAIIFHGHVSVRVINLLRIIDLDKEVLVGVVSLSFDKYIKSNSITIAEIQHL